MLELSANCIKENILNMYYTIGTSILSASTMPLGLIMVRIEIHVRTHTSVRESDSNTLITDRNPNISADIENSNKTNTAVE